MADEFKTVAELFQHVASMANWDQDHDVTVSTAIIRCIWDMQTQCAERIDELEVQLRKYQAAEIPHGTR